MTKKLNGYARWVIIAIAIGGIVWNAATLHNDVKHLKDDIQEIRQDVKQIKEAVFAPKLK
jgi:hypothetical protein